MPAIGDRVHDEEYCFKDDQDIPYGTDAINLWHADQCRLMVSWVDNRGVNEFLLDFPRHFYLKPLTAPAFPLGIEMATTFITTNEINKA